MLSENIGTLPALKLCFSPPQLLCSVGHSEEKLGFSYEEIIIWWVFGLIDSCIVFLLEYSCLYVFPDVPLQSLRLALLNEAKEVRAAGLRALRYLIRDSSVLEKVLQLQVDYLIARWGNTAQLKEAEFSNQSSSCHVVRPADSGSVCTVIITITLMFLNIDTQHSPRWCKNPEGLSCGHKI